MTGVMTASQLLLRVGGQAGADDRQRLVDQRRHAALRLTDQAPLLGERVGQPGADVVPLPTLHVPVRAVLEVDAARQMPVGLAGSHGRRVGSLAAAAEAPRQTAS